MPKFTRLLPSWYEDACVASGPLFFYAPEDKDAALARISEKIKELKSSGVTCAMVYGDSYRNEPGNIWSHVGDKKRIWHFRFGNADMMEDYVRCVREGIALYKEAGFKVVMHFAPGLSWRDLHGLTYKGRDCGEFMMESARPGYEHYPGYDTTWMICQNKPLARLSILEHAQELADCGLDGMFIHDLNYRVNYYVCACKHCRERYAQHTGFEMPDYPEPSFWNNWENQAWRDYCRWRQVNHGEFYKEAWKVIGEHREDFVLSFCTCESSPSSGLRLYPACWEESQPGTNVVFYENWGHSWYFSWRRYAWEYVVSRAFGYSHGNPTLGLSYPHSEEEKPGDWAHMLMNGINSWRHDAAPMDNNAPSSEQKTIKWELQYKDLLRHVSPAAEVAILFSRSTRDYYRQTSADRYQSDLFTDEAAGWYQTLIEAQIPVRIVMEDTLDAKELAEVSVLILPNVGCMDSATASLIRNWVSKGGNLVATGETSLFDTRGNKRTDFLLGDLFGLRYLHTEGLYHLAMTIDEAKTGCSEPSPLLGGLSGRIQHREAQVLTEIVSDDVTQLASIWHYYQDFERYPGLAERQFGGGRVVYISGRPGRHHHVPLAACMVPDNNYILHDREYIDERVPEWGVIIRAIVNELMPETPMIRLENLPQGVIANTMTRPDGGLNIYLLNMSGSKWKHKELIPLNYNTDKYDVPTPFNAMKEPFSVCVRGKQPDAMLISPDLHEEVKIKARYADEVTYYDLAPEHLSCFSMIVL